MSINKGISYALALTSLLLLQAYPAIAETLAPITAQPASELVPADTLDLVLLEVLLDTYSQSDAIIGYQQGTEIFLPLGELAQLLTLAITTQPEQGTAHGFIIDKQRSFELDLASAQLTLAGQAQTIDLSMLYSTSDDIYIASTLITRWLPIDLNLNLSNLTLQVTARERLPLQDRLERERLGAKAGISTDDEDPDYPRYTTPYQLLSVPFIDQTIETSAITGDGQSKTSTSYTSYLTGDLLGMGAAVFISSQQQAASPQVRFTLGRNDPDAGLLGPLHARSVLFGSAVALPSVTNIASGGSSGDGYSLMLSNQPLDQPSNFDSHSLQGDLPPGWDVELYFNDALVGFQSSRADGRYNFDDQPLTYGNNEFRLVFRGPLGEQREEQQNFSLEQSSTPPGSFYYTLGQQQDQSNQSRSMAQFEWGLSKYLTATGALAHLPPLLDSSTESSQQYLSLGLRGFWQKVIFSSDFFSSPDGGLLNESGLKTQIGDVAISYSHTRLNDFTSELFLPSSDPLRSRDKLRLDGAIPVWLLPRLPITFEIKSEEFASGKKDLSLSSRVAAYINRTSLSNQVSWLTSPASTLASGVLQISHRTEHIGISGQLLYNIKPQTDLQSLTLTGDKRLGKGYQVNANIVQTIDSKATVLGLGISKSLGSYGLRLNTSYSNDGLLTAGLQLFASLGKEPRQAQWHLDALPVADSGAASVRVFLDSNANGIMDEDEEPIKDVAIIVNGSGLPVLTNSSGIAWLDRLPVHQYVSIAVKTQTLMDPYWVSQKKGTQLILRPGLVAEIDFPIVLTSEIDGTVYLGSIESKRGIGNVLIELVNDQQKIVASTKSSSDGFYIIPEVAQGRYTLRISPEQLQELELLDPGSLEITIRPNGDFVNGADFLLSQ